MTKIYLGTTFTDRDDVKKHGAKWDFIEKRWYCEKGLRKSNPKNYKYLIKKYPSNSKPITELLGEDRTFGGNELYVDLIPNTCWFNNVRSCIDPKDWDRLRKFVYSRADHKCEVCGKTPIQSLEAHERWSYNITTFTQKLERLIALCHECHQTTHMGLARVKNRDKQAREHLQEITGMNYHDASNHIDHAFDIWRVRNKITWNLDLNLITENDIKLAQNSQQQKNVKDMDEYARSICRYEYEIGIDEAEYKKQERDYKYALNCFNGDTKKEELCVIFIIDGKQIEAKGDDIGKYFELLASN